jgi:hypothetical protein
MRSSLAALVLLAVGCQRQPSADTGLSGGGGSSPMSGAGDASSSTGDAVTSTSAGATSAPASTSTSDASSTTEGLRLDMGLPDLPQGSACNGKIDLVFVITQQGHFINYIDTLYDSYPEIIATIEEVFADVDLHVMFADPNNKWGATPCPKGMCPEDGGCTADGYEDFPCWVLYDEEALTKCDNTSGSGIIFPAGNSASNKPCDLPEGQRYIAGDDPLFVERFSCVSRTGLGGGFSEPGWALGEAVSLDLQEGCNAGFFRDDALLFAVIVSTHDYSPYNPYVWAQRVLEAKEFDQDMIVALGIADDWQAIEPALCGPGSIGDPPHETFRWAEEFEHRVFGSICAPTFAPFFAEAATMAADLCANGSQN